MTQNATTVPIQGNRQYVQALKALAYSQGLTIAQLVRQAIDSQYGQDLQPHLDFFCADSGCKKVHVDTVKSETQPSVS